MASVSYLSSHSSLSSYGSLHQNKRYMHIYVTSFINHQGCNFNACQTFFLFGFLLFCFVLFCSDMHAIAVEDWDHDDYSYTHLLHNCTALNLLAPWSSYTKKISWKCGTSSRSSHVCFSSCCHGEYLLRRFKILSFSVLIVLCTPLMHLVSEYVLQKKVIETKSVEYMPFSLSFFSFLASALWLAYGLLGQDLLIAVSTMQTRIFVFFFS